MQVENETSMSEEARSRDVPSLKEAKRMAKQRGTNRWNELELHVSYPLFLHSDVVLLGG